MTDTMPTLQDLKQRLYLAFQASSRDLPDFSDEKITSAVLAGMFHELYLKNSITAKNIFPDLADSRAIFNHARVWGKERRPATTASGLVRFLAEQDLVIDAKLILQDSDGDKYRTLTSQNLSSNDDSTLKIFVEALEPGKKFNKPPGTILTPVQSVAGLRQAETIGNGITGGTDTGSLEQLRLDIIRRFQSYEGRGGNNDDWQKWLSEIPSSFRSFYFPRFGGAGSVGYAFVVRLPDDTIGLPNEIQTDRAEAQINSKKPDLATLIRAAITLKPVNFTVEANFSDLQKRYVVNNLKQLFLESAYVPEAFGSSTGTITRNDLITSIRTAAGDSSFRLISPTDDLIPRNLELLKFGRLDVTGRQLEY